MQGVELFPSSYSCRNTLSKDLFLSLPSSSSNSNSSSSLQFISLSKRSLSHHISLFLNTKRQQRKENENEEEEEDEPNVPIETINGLENCDEEEEDYVPAIAIVGRPNIGKSSILNALVGEDRTIVSPISGPTHDAIDTEFSGSDGQVEEFLVVVDELLDADEVFCMEQLWLCYLWTALRI